MNKVNLCLLLLFLLNNVEEIKLSNTTTPLLYLVPFRYVSATKNFLPTAETLNLSDDKYSTGFEIENDTTSFKINGKRTAKNVRNETGRKPVKLTMKQGLLMNQVLSVYALENVQDEVCRNHIKEFKIGLRAFETWALQMFDSSSKIQSGILLGNLLDFGSFSQCLQIYKQTEFGPIYGKHCLLKIKPSIQLIKKILSFRNVSEKRFVKVYTTVEKSELAWSVCVPHTCSRDDILRHFNKTILEMAEGLDVTVNLDDNYCNTVFNQPVMGKKQYIVLLFLGSFIILGILAAALDLRSEEENVNLFIDTCSAYRNLQRIMKIGRSRKELHFLHGLKTFSSWSVVIGHRYIMYIMFPVINQLEELDWIVQLSSTIILGSTVSVDSFFMTSGMLVSNGFFEYVTKTGHFNLILFYLHRYLRVTLPLAIVVLFYVTLPQFIGSGPLLYDVYLSHQKSCQDYWWSTLLHIQAYVNPSHLCIYPIWYLSNEMIFYFLSPVILYPLWKWPKFGYVNILVLWILAIMISFYYAWVNEYNGEVLPITNQLFDTKYFTKYYVPPHIRAAPYIIGLGFGYVIFQTKGQKIKINKWLNILLWGLSLAVMTSTVIGSRNFYLEDHEYNRLEVSVYLAFSRSAWTLGVAWIIWSCMHGYGGIINGFLSANAFQPFGRITYGIFLIHTIIQLYKNGSAKAPMTFSNMNVIFDGFADYFSVLLVSLFFTIFYELPLVQAEALIFKQRSSIHGFAHMVERKAHPMERLMWWGMIAGAIYGAVILSSMTLTRYRNNPTVISMERDRFSWNTSFPAATICPTTKVDSDAIDRFLSESKSIINKTCFREFVISLSEATYTNFDMVPYCDGIPSDNFINLLRQFMYKFRPSVSNSGRIMENNNGQSLTLHETVAEMGICYSLNSHLAIYNSFDYWNKGHWKLLPENNTFSVNPLDGEVFANVVNMSSGFQVYIHGPYEVVDIASKYISSPNGYFLQLYLSGLTLFSSESTKSLGIDQRKCRFYYESDLRHSPVYSYVLCRMECRASLANRLCGCTPHFYRKLDGERVCNVTGLHCLSKYKERLTLLKNECSCLANCDEVNYVIEDVDTREWFLGSNLQWGFKDYPKMRLRRDVIFGFADLLVYIGGMAGLFLGCSVLSFIEIVYFFTLRLYWYATKYGKESRSNF